MAELREAWPERLRRIEPARLVFLDESGAKTNMTPAYGRNFGGQRLVDHAPCGHYRLTSVIGALRLGGVGACMTVEAAVDGDCFEAYVASFLAPSLRPGDVVVMDNLSSHKRPSVRRLIAARGASVLWLPPYSPVRLPPIIGPWR